MNYWAIAIFAAIVACLVTAYVYLIKGNKDPSTPNRSMAKALGFRVALSILLFLCILAGWKLGYIHPTGIPLKG